MDVKFKLVADINRKGEGANVVNNPVREDNKPRVDIKTEVETGKGKFDGTGTGTSAQDAEKIAKQSGGAVAVGKGGGVVGMLIATKRDIPDPEAMSWQQLRTALQPHFGKAVLITSYDRDEAKNIAEAAKSSSIGDNFGILRDVKEDGVVIEKDKQLLTVKTEFWAIARIKTAEGEVLAQDPAYPKHFTD
jgi:hypothetical protein